MPPRSQRKLAPHRVNSKLNVERLEQRRLLTGVACEPVVDLTGNVVTVIGQATDDTVQLELGTDTHVLQFSDHEYIFDAQAVDEFHIAGGFGDNSIRVIGSELAETAQINGLRSTILADSYRVETYQFANTILVGSAIDFAEVYGSHQSDDVHAFPESTSMSRPDATSIAEGFGEVRVYGVDGNDTASLYGSDLDDWMSSVGDYVRLVNATGPEVRAINFDRVNVYGRGGQGDKSVLLDTPGDDHFASHWDFASMETPERLTYTKGFEFVEARSSGQGIDSAGFLGGGVTLMSSPTETAITNRFTYQHITKNFNQFYANGLGNAGNEVIVSGLTPQDELVYELGGFTFFGPDRSMNVDGFHDIAVDDVYASSELQDFRDSFEPFLPPRVDRTSIQAGKQILGTEENDVFNVFPTGSASSFFGFAGDDRMSPANGIGYYRGGSGADIIDAGNGFDIIFGDEGNDILLSGGLADNILGGSGNDFIFSGNGNDLISGGSGFDTFRFQANQLANWISDFNPNEDRIEVVGLNTFVGAYAGSGFLAVNIGGTEVFLIGVDPTLTLEDLNIEFVAG